jgi:hypothetical protein
MDAGDTVRDLPVLEVALPGTRLLGAAAGDEGLAAAGGASASASTPEGLILPGVLRERRWFSA